MWCPMAILILIIISLLVSSSSCTTTLPLSTSVSGISPITRPSLNTKIFNVISFGATGDGVIDDSQVFLETWEAACKFTTTSSVKTVSIMEIPAGRNFLLKPVSFQGPCNSSMIQVLVMGNLVAPGRKLDWTNCEFGSWIVFSGVSNLVVKGSGEINGRGEIWWPGSASSKDVVGECVRPTALRFQDCHGFVLSGGLTLKNSPRNHISIFKCSRSIISNIHIIAPENSPNTDGIDISHSTNIDIINLTIRTGDDCIAIGPGSSWINVTGVNCGPGHGISIGSLGMNGHTEEVEHVHVHNCTFLKTLTGARIKTWQGGSGFARNIKFSSITLIEPWNPIIIDQFYCNGRGDCPIMPSAVQVSDVTFTGIHGTVSSGTNMAIILNCSATVPCSNILLEDVDIHHGGGGRGRQKMEDTVVAFSNNAFVHCNSLVRPRPVNC